MPKHYKFTAVPDVFTSFAAACAADPSLKITTQPDLALIPRAYESDGPGDEGASQWARFAKYVRWLNERAEEGVCYKVLYLTRHGKGWHNVVHERVGNEEWDNHLSRLEGDGTITWSDAHLTEEGESQARALSAFWSSLLQSGAPLPTLYSSPLTRCLQTTTLIWRPILASLSLPFRPLIKERLREQLTDHTCDRRSPLTRIRSLFPDFAVEDGFTEDDELWRADKWESLRDHCERKQRVLEEIFEADAAQFVSLTVHSYAIAVILHVCGAEMFRVREGSSIGILVRAEEVGEAPAFDVGDRLEGY
ncbi:hypothetical protein VUR80DRAFT_9791 [Thermomyces stellatus]